MIDELPAHGAERLLVDVLRHRSPVFDYHVVCLMRGGDLEPEIRALGIPLTILGYRGKFDISLVWRLARWLRANRISVVHTHLFTADTWGRLAARVAGVRPVFTTVHSTNQWKSKLYRWVDRVLARITTRVIACSEEVGEVLVRQDRLPTARVQVVRNGIALERFAGASAEGVRAEFGVDRGCPLIALVGRFHPAKGHPDLIAALAQLRQRNIAYRCLFVGEGELQAELAAEVKRQGLDQQVIFTGQRRDIPRLLAATDVLLLPSRWEGLPMILLEGMAMGCTVIATKVGGIPDVITDNKDGLLIAPADVAGLTETLQRALNDAPLRARLGAAARETIRQRYSVTVTAAAYESLYRDALGLTPRQSATSAAKPREAR
ncbi:MAG: glycosyltransferase [Gammaproteobacteria bacterium]|nr:glycosyltransferase [Gammaproteobacteria bacterium]